MPELPEVETVRQVIEQQIQGLTIEKITVRRPEERHTHIIFRLDNGKELRFSDTRRFGRFCLIRNGETDTYSGIEKLGKEPFDPDFTAEYLSARLGKRKKAIKECLREQSVIAGIIPQQLVFTSLRSCGRALFRVRKASLPTCPCCESLKMPGIPVSQSGCQRRYGESGQECRR